MNSDPEKNTRIEHDLRELRVVGFCTIERLNSRGYNGIKTESGTL